MPRPSVKFEIVEGEREGISYGGKRHRKKTVLLKVGRYSISLRAFQLGMILIACQVLDGFLTYIGLRIYGVRMEGNVFLRELMLAYGAFTALVLAKLFAFFCIVILTVYSHKRRWIRPFIAGMCGIYLTLAVIPWVYIISKAHANGIPISSVFKTESIPDSAKESGTEVKN